MIDLAPLKSMFPHLFSITLGKNATISSFFSPPNNWNFHLRRDLRNEEISEISSLLSLLQAQRVSLASLANSRIWTLSSSALFSVPSFCQALTFPSLGLYPLFPHIRVWCSSSRLKVQSSIWNVAWGRVLTSRRVHTIHPHLFWSPHICVLCYSNSKTND